MSVLQITTTPQEDWIKRFDPHKRFLTGPTYLLTKRLMDLFLVILTFPLWLPLNGIIALIIRITSPGAPVVFKQLRTGKGGRRFYMYKFRTMVPNAEELKSKYAHLNELQWPDFKITNDPRITPIGKFLRKTSLDEIPQLFNVLKGEMSLVGPRPHVPGMLAADLPYEDLVPYYFQRHTARPGITGLAQVSGCRGSTAEFGPAVSRIDYDLHYIEQWSLRMDVMIIIRTIRKEFLSGSGF